MKTIIELKGPDIEKILAKHFGVDEKDVEVEVGYEYRGYGMNEHEEAIVVATVTKPEEEP